MPRKRNSENEGLPERWRFYHGAYYYQVPRGMEPYWDHRRQFRLGGTYEEAMKAYLERMASPEVAADIPESQMLCDSSIIDGSFPFAKSGVYFLIRGKTVVYVGRSDNVAARIASHAANPDIKFDRVHWIAASGLEQVRLEQLYIGRFRPEKNIYHANL